MTDGPPGFKDPNRPIGKELSERIDWIVAHPESGYGGVERDLDDEDVRILDQIWAEIHAEEAMAEKSRGLETFWSEEELEIADGVWDELAEEEERDGLAPERCEDSSQGIVAREADESSHGRSSTNNPDCPETQRVINRRSTDSPRNADQE
jgi:hypothetical protein